MRVLKPEAQNTHLDWKWQLERALWGQGECSVLVMGFKTFYICHNPEFPLKNR